MLSLWLRLRDDPDSVADTIIVGGATERHESGIKPGPLDHQSAATPSAGRPDAEAAQAETDGPAADPIADLCVKIRAQPDPLTLTVLPLAYVEVQRELLHKAADALERLARDHSKERSGRIAVRAELSAERDRHKRTSERAERAEAERDALRECVKAADKLRYNYFMGDGKLYDAARAKVKP